MKLRGHVVVACVSALTLVSTVTSPAIGADDTKPLYQGSAYYEPPVSLRGAIATVHPAASQIGIDILDDGGNAMDAAVAVAFALGVLRPEMTGPGGGGFLVYRSADGAEVNTLDFREAAPADIGEWDRTQAGIDDYGYFAFAGAGHRVVGVPGNVAGLAAALDRYGSKSLADVTEPAARIAEKGFIVSEELQNFLFLGIPYLRLFPETARIFLHDSAVSYPSRPAFDALIDNTPGDFWLLKQPDHARTLRLIGKHGPDVFYKGEIADLLLQDFANTGTCDPNAAWTCYPGDRARLEREDLAGYQPLWRKPIRTNYRGHEIVGAPPPASGGIFVAEVLNILEGLEFTEGGFANADHLHYLTEATKIALADRKAYLGDPDFVDIPVRKLTSRKYAAERRAEIDRYKAQVYEPASVGAPSSHTTHLSVIDEAGNAVSMTLSLNGAFGSGVVAPGTGFLLNNHLLDFDTLNAAGQPSNGQTGPNNAPGPGRRPVSALSPTIVVRHGKALLVVGGAGGPTILRGVPQTVINTIDFEMGVGHALDAPRIFPANEAASLGSVGGLDDLDDGAVDVLDMEGGPGDNPRIPEAVKQQLRNRGHRLTGEDTEYSGLPTLGAVATDLRTGYHLAYTDTRGEEGPAVQ